MPTTHPPTTTTRTLLPANRWPTLTLRGGDGLRVVFFPDGTLRGIWSHHILISRLLADPLGGGMSRLFLRQHHTDGHVESHEALGPHAASTFTHTDTTATWTGTRPLPYTITLRLDPDAPRWSWHVQVSTPDAQAATWDAILVQDVGLAAEGTVRSNEKYVSQYLDHRIETHAAQGPVVMSRQALPQKDHAHPWLLAACAPRAAAAMTDGVAFFGTAHKAHAQPQHAHTPTLPTAVTQHESAAVILQSAPGIAPGSTDPKNPDPTSSVSFDFAFEHHHPAPSSDDDLHKVAPLFDASPPTPKAQEKHSNKTPGPQQKNHHTRHPLRSGDHPTDADLESWFGPRNAWRHLEQTRNDQPASFFHGPDRHVATFAKDADLRRGHGHILRTGKSWLPDHRTLCATCYQHGVFASQLTLGNTTFGALSGVARDPINLDRAAGLRIALNLDNTNDDRDFVQLAVASAFEIAPGWCRWYYRLGDRTVTIRAVASPDAPLLRYELRVTQGPPLRVRLTQHFSLGDYGNGQTTTLDIDHPAATITATPGSPGTPNQPGDSNMARAFPDTRCALAFDQTDALRHLDTLPINPDQPDEGSWPYLRADTADVDSLRWSFAASPDAAGMPADLQPDIDATANAADAYWSQLHAPLTERFPAPQTPPPQAPNTKNDLTRLREVVPWFVHNAMIHLSVPHGLEQFGGAAWGTRDVCQGSVELLLAIDQPDAVADILRVVFRHQHRQTGDWPQWFMHAPFNNVQAGDSHGDVVVWPLYALCHYLEETNHTAILDETLGYTDADPANGFPFSASTHDATLRRHVQHALERITSQRIPGTTLPRYGHGDWNDSLQPAQPWMADRMVSSWTVALLQHTLARLSRAVKSCDPAWSQELAQHAADVAADFQKWCIVDGQVAGILLFSADFASAEPLLHPTDTRTGIHHSLIPINRALLADLFTPEQAEHHRSVIADHLLAPDGVRLMERPPQYTGGLTTFFQRAESAAFFGREIGLMYTHAHLRYAESLITNHQPAAALEALNAVNPVALQSHVPNAAPRQANAYFSSSDARFTTRHHADTDHPRVYAGTITVDGGWRIYSSGPGIFLHLLRRALQNTHPAGASDSSHSPTA